MADTGLTTPNSSVNPALQKSYAGISTNQQIAQQAATQSTSAAQKQAVPTQTAAKSAELSPFPMSMSGKIVSAQSMVGGGQRVLFQQEQPNIQPFQEGNQMSPVQKQVYAAGATFEGLPIISFLNEKVSISQQKRAENPNDLFGNSFRQVGESVLGTPEGLGKATLAVGGIFKSYLTGDIQAIGEGTQSSREQTTYLAGRYASGDLSVWLPTMMTAGLFFVAAKSVAYNKAHPKANPIIKTEVRNVDVSPRVTEIATENYQTGTGFQATIIDKGVGITTQKTIFGRAIPFTQKTTYVQATGETGGVYFRTPEISYTAKVGSAEGMNPMNVQMRSVSDVSISARQNAQFVPSKTSVGVLPKESPLGQAPLGTSYISPKSPSVFVQSEPMPTQGVLMEYQGLEGWKVNVNYPKFATTRTFAESSPTFTEVSTLPQKNVQSVNMLNPKTDQMLNPLSQPIDAISGVRLKGSVKETPILSREVTNIRAVGETPSAISEISMKTTDLISGGKESAFGISGTVGKAKISGTGIFESMDWAGKGKVVSEGNIFPTTISQSKIDFVRFVDTGAKGTLTLQKQVTIPSSALGTVSTAAIAKAAQASISNAPTSPPISGSLPFYPSATKTVSRERTQSPFGGQVGATRANTNEIFNKGKSKELNFPTSKILQNTGQKQPQILMQLQQQQQMQRQNLRTRETTITTPQTIDIQGIRQKQPEITLTDQKMATLDPQKFKIGFFTPDFPNPTFGGGTGLALPDIGGFGLGGGRGKGRKIKASLLDTLSVEFKVRGKRR